MTETKTAANGLIWLDSMNLDYKMTYDDKISETVSLSRVLDCLIEEQSSPSTIIWFLKDHYEDIVDILKFSNLAERMFFLDFISKCSINEMHEILRMMKVVYKNDPSSNLNVISSYLVWQILQSDLPDNVKMLFRPFLNSIKPIRHPYSGISRRPMIEEFDKIFKSSKETVYSIAVAINGLYDEDFDKVCSQISHSLFSNRLFQLDIFDLLDDNKKFILLKSAKRENSITRNVRFFRQILKSDVEVGIKMFVYDIIKENEFNYKYITKNILSRFVQSNEILRKSESAAEVMMNVNLYGIDDNSEDMIFLLLLEGKIDWLVEIMDTDREFIEKNFNICDLLEGIKENGRCQN